VVRGKAALPHPELASTRARVADRQDNAAPTGCPGDRTRETHFACDPRTAAALRLGYHRVIGTLGAGGMGDVYRARDTTLGRDVALKRLPEGTAASSEKLSRFGREARLLASLNHPNVATLHGLENADGQELLVMELVHLARLVRPRRRPELA
jgi:serine/threonine protein kinase